MDARTLTIPEPCPADWDAMGGRPGDRARYCDHCQTRVHDLSAMGEREAEAFLAATRDVGVCVSYVLEPDGSVRFAGPDAPRPAPLIPAHRLRPRNTAARAAVKTAVAGALAACAPHGEPEVLEMDEVSDRAEVHTAIYDDPQIPQRDTAVETPCDPPAEAAEAEIEPEPRVPRRTVGRRPARKKGKLKLDERTMGFL